MDLNTFFIMVAPPLIVLLAIISLFLWGSKKGSNDWWEESNRP